MILNLLNLYTLIFALFGKVNAMTTRLAVMKANISQQGLNLADLLDHTSATPVFNAAAESSAYYNVTDPILFVLNATESPGTMDSYASTSTEPAAAATEDYGALAGTCFQILVDCSTLETADPPLATTTAGPAISEEDEIVYDEEDYETVPERMKRDLDQTTTASANPWPTPSRTTPQSIGRLLDSLNSILRNLKRNTTARAPLTTLPWSTSTESPSTTTSPRVESTTTSPPESLDDLMRWHTAGLILTTEEDYEESGDNSSSSIFDAFNQTNPADDFTSSSPDDETTTTRLPEEAVVTTTTVRPMCPLVVCPWNDTVGYFTSLTTPGGAGGEDDANGTLPCRGDNPQGCTPFWTSSRDESITSFHSSVHFAASTQSSNGRHVIPTPLIMN